MAVAGLRACPPFVSLHRLGTSGPNAAWRRRRSRRVPPRPPPHGASSARCVCCVVAAHRLMSCRRRLRGAPNARGWAKSHSWGGGPGFWPRAAKSPHQFQFNCLSQSPSRSTRRAPPHNSGAPACPAQAMSCRSSCWSARARSRQTARQAPPLAPGRRDPRPARAHVAIAPPPAAARAKAQPRPRVPRGRLRPRRRGASLG